MNSAFKAAVMMMVCVFTLGFTSCSSDDDDDPAYSDPNIVGTWVINTITEDGVVIDMSSHQNAITFTESGKAQFSGDWGDESATCKMTGNTIKLYDDGDKVAQVNIITLTATTVKFNLDFEGLADEQDMVYAATKK